MLIQNIKEKLDEKIERRLDGDDSDILLDEINALRRELLACAKDEALVNGSSAVIVACSRETPIYKKTLGINAYEQDYERANMIQAHNDNQYLFTTKEKLLYDVQNHYVSVNKARGYLEFLNEHDKADILKKLEELESKLI